MVVLPHSAQSNHAFFGEYKKCQTKKIVPKKKIALELLHQILGHIYTIFLIAIDSANVWKYIEIRIDPDPFCTLCQIYSINKKARSKNPLYPKAHFKWFY